MKEINKKWKNNTLNPRNHLELQKTAGRSATPRLEQQHLPVKPENRLAFTPAPWLLRETRISQLFVRMERREKGEEEGGREEGDRGREEEGGTEGGRGRKEGRKEGETGRKGERDKGRKGKRKGGGREAEGERREIGVREGGREGGI